MLSEALSASKKTDVQTLYINVTQIKCQATLKQCYVCVLGWWCSGMCVWPGDVVLCVSDITIQCKVYVTWWCNAMHVWHVMQCYVHMTWWLTWWCSAMYIWPGDAVLQESGQVMQCNVSLARWCSTTWVARWWVLCESGQVMQCYVSLARWWVLCESGQVMSAMWVWPGDECYVSLARLT